MSFYPRAQSAAIKIVKPSTAVDESNSPKIPFSPARKDSVQRQCRNIVIYGHCKYQDKGCIYYHPSLGDNTQSAPSSPVPPPASTPAAVLTRSESPAATPITAQAVNAPVFVPRTAGAVAAAVSGSNLKNLATPSPSASPIPAFVRQQQQNEEADHTRQESWTSDEHSSANDETAAYENGAESATNGYGHQSQQASEQSQNGYQHSGGQGYSYSAGEYDNYDYQAEQAISAMQGMEVSDYANQEYPRAYENEMEASYYNHAPIFVRQPLNYLLYTPILPPELIRNSTASHFAPPSSELRQILQERSETTRGIAPAALQLPEELMGYHTLVPLEPTGAGVERRKFGNWHSTVYRAIRASDGIPFMFRRIENFRMIHQAAFGPIEQWSSIQHPGLVALQEAFTTRAFNDNSLIVSYAYHPNSKTLYEAHVKPKPPSSSPFQQTTFYGRQRQQQQQQQQTIPERILWSYIVQLASAIKKVHERGLAVRMVEVTKILVTGQNRIRIGSCGIFDVLLYDTPQQDVAYMQQEDLVMLGRVIFILCTNNMGSANSNNISKSMESIKRVYSTDLQTLALFLISKMPKSIDQVLDMMRGRLLAEQDEALIATDRLEHELMGELENARLVRLMFKFGFINERPEFARDPRWSETGDRYIIKLFRDYVFHQVDENGNPVLDLGHVLTCLNKLDAGTDEKLMLVSRDEQSCLVVSYKDIKTCVSNAFDELVRSMTVRK